MRWIIRGLPGVQVAACVSAVRRGNLQMIIIVDVALLAEQVGVAERQREVDRRRGVISAETRLEPAIEGWVAALAIAWRKIGRVGRVRRIRRALPILQVARLTFRRESVENSGRCLFVAVFALHRRMRSEQREAVLVILHLLDSNVPALNRVTLRAIRSHLPPMNILVAIGAILPHVFEDRLHMALLARHLLVQPTQWIVRFVVIEFRHRAYGAPAGRSMTVLTGYVERPVRILRSLVLWIARLVQRPGAPDHRPPLRTWEHQ